MDIFGRDSFDLGLNYTASSNPHAHPMSYSTATSEFTVHDGPIEPQIRFAFLYILPWLGEYAGQGWEKIILVAADHIYTNLIERFNFYGDLTVIAMPVIDATFLFYAVPHESEKPALKLRPVHRAPSATGFAKETTFGASVAPAAFLSLD
jgi:hypothetical protein